MREENQTIIKALNMFGRVPETWELLNEIERLKNTINKAIDRLDISGDIQAGQYEWVLTTTINETKNILKEGK